ncbi:alpha-(1-_3)-arabinofuranosyltransferase domain-containing protein [Plantactinospora endophytica]|uniref:F5/8 type C domain-containing protein n=1 Tax=Plantactinospora endophytica TaxID=673535 RepID=A0ABQ4E1H8_9ACTN|nr:hypothetical protein Pen02_34890 [Plantactinospora endophytica]
MTRGPATGSDRAPLVSPAAGADGPSDDTAGASPDAATRTGSGGTDEPVAGRARVVWRLRHAAVCVLLGALAFLQDPGMMVVDTKVDLAVNPLGWLERSLHVWDPAGTFGQLQNQAYGYLWPMGPFFLAGDLAGVPMWAVQRLWWTLLLCVGYLGVVTLAGRLHIGTPVARLVAGVAFALSPRLVTEIGPVSVEAWPSAVAPWVLVPLVGLARNPSTPLRRAVTLSALAVACAGGVNATAVLAVVPLAALWLCTLRPLRRRVVALVAWGTAVAAATAWWLVPLLLLGRYSPPFLDYIETAEVTTRPTDVVSVLRGTAHWHAYLTDAHGPLWPGGWRLATVAPLVVATLVVAGTGLVGLARRGMPHRRFLLTGLLVGLALVGLGHVAAGPLGGAVTGSGLFADAARTFLDGAGAPLRNVHKFDVVLRLPLVLGLAHLLGLVGRAATVTAGPWRPPPRRRTAAARAVGAGATAEDWPVEVGPARPPVAAAGATAEDRSAVDGGPASRPVTTVGAARTMVDPVPPPPYVPALSLTRLRAVTVTVLVLAGVVGVGTPAVTGHLAAPGSFFNVPGYWREAAGWLDQRLDHERVLVVPAARFPRYLWGNPSDEITQPLLDAPWAVRSSIPLTPTMTIRLLDAVESVVATGQGSAGLAQVLSRSGVRYLLVRSDLDYGQARSARPLAVRQALARSPGISRVASFGPTVGGGFLPGTFNDRGLDVAVPAVEIFEVDGAVQPVVAYDAADVTTVVGGPESLLDLAAVDRLPAAPTVLAVDRPPDWPAGAPVTLTDGLRRRETAFGLLQDNSSATMARWDEWRLSAPAHDYLSPAATEHTTMVRYEGIAGVRASSSWADAQPLHGSRPAHHPYAALDGDPGTSWRTPPQTVSEGQWLEVELLRPQPVAEVALDFDLGADTLPTRVTVAAGVDVRTVETFGAGVVVRLSGAASTKRVLVRIDGVVDVRKGGGGVGLAEVRIPDVRAERSLLVRPVPEQRSAGEVGTAADGAATSPTVVLTVAPSVPACLFDEGRPRCVRSLARASEDADLLDRTLTLPGTSDTGYLPSVWARPRPGPALDAVLDRSRAEPEVTASSTGVEDPAARPGVVVDGNPATSWSPATDDGHPWLRLAFPARRLVTGLRFAVDPSVAGARPWTITAIGDDGVRGGLVAEDGTVTFGEPLDTDDLSVLITDTAAARTHDPYLDFWEPLPVAVGELSALPAEAIIPADPAERITLPCGSGPKVEVAGTTLLTKIGGTRQELLELRELPATVCQVEGGRTAPDARLVLPAGESRVRATPTTLATPTRVVLDPTPSKPASSKPAQSKPAPSEPASSATASSTAVEIRSWSPAERRLLLTTHGVDRVLAMRENANPGWRASIGGRQLTPVTLDGWQQGFVVPAGVDGTVLVRFASAGAYRTGLLVGAGLLAVLALVAVLPGRRRGPVRGARSGGDAGAPLSRRRGWLLVAGVGGTALVATGGYAAIGLTALALAAVLVYWALLPQLCGPDRRAVLRTVRAAARWLPPVCFAVAGWLAWRAAGDPAGATGTTMIAAQLFGLTSVVALWLSAVLPSRRPNRPDQRPVRPVPAGRADPPPRPDLPGQRAATRSNGRSTSA